MGGTGKPHFVVESMRWRLLHLGGFWEFGGSLTAVATLLLLLLLLLVYQEQDRALKEAPKEAAQGLSSVASSAAWSPLSSSSARLRGKARPPMYSPLINRFNNMLSLSNSRPNN